MEFRKGDRVLVNLAVFTGAARRSRHWISCDVVDVEPSQVAVKTAWPCREITIWANKAWVKNETVLVESV